MLNKSAGFTVPMVAQVSAGRIVMRRSDTHYQEETRGARDARGRFRLTGEGHYFKDAERPWQTLVIEQLAGGSADGAMENTSTIVNFNGRAVRDCRFTLNRQR